MAVYSAGQAQFRINFEISPITLVGGIAGDVSGGALPITMLLGGASPNGLLQSANVGLDDAFGYFYPLPGSGLIENQLGEYPFANLAIAANAIVKQPLNVSLLMRCPVKDAGGYQTKLAIITGLQNTLANHCARGGTFIVATPSYYYTNCILLGLHDVSGGETQQAQIEWRWDFRRPLISLEQADPSLNSLMRQMSSGAMTTGSLTGRDMGAPPNVASPAILPSSANAASAGVPATSR